LERILHIVSGMGYGGIETFLMNSYRIIDRDRIQFDFLLDKKEETDYTSEIRKLGGRIYHIPARHEGIFKNIRALDDFFKEHYREYKIVHMHGSSLSYIEPLKAAKKYNVPIRIMHSHSSKLAKGNYIHYFLHKFYQRKILSYANKLFACSDKAAKWMYGFNKDQAVILNNGIDTSRFAFNSLTRNKYRKELKLEQKFVIGHVGRFDYPKNQNRLISIFLEVKKINPNAVLVLVGDGLLKNKVQSEVERLKLTESVYFLGIRSDINNVMQAMDSFVFPSIYEGFPVTLVEAQTSGLSCFVSNTITKQIKLSDLVEFIDLNQNDRVWAELLCKSVNNDRSKYCEQIRNSGYDIKVVGKEIEDFYLKLIGEWENEFKNK